MFAGLKLSARTSVRDRVADVSHGAAMGLEGEGARPDRRPRAPRWRVRPVWLLIGLILLAPWWANDGRVRLSFADRVEAIIGARGLSIVEWELATLAERGAELLPGRRPEATAADVQRVHDYFAAVDRVNRLERRETELLAAQPPGWEADLATVRSDLTQARRQRDELAAPARVVLEAQFAMVIEDLGLRHALIELRGTDGWPPFDVRVTPAIFFTFTRLPLALSIGPRDRIAITYSALLDSDLDVPEREALEAGLDSRLNVASIVTPIGGFAAYPSMIPQSAGLSASLNTIAHEWIHHYLAFRPLGWNYFASYDMRMLNETVADIAGQEIADEVRRRYHPPPATPAPATRPTSPAPPADREDFASAMRRIRRETEALLATGDLDAVERYLADQRRRLADQGYYLRKLNTTYLAFFGSYSGAGNRVEPGLRMLRQRSPSLAAFLDTIAAAGTPEQARRIIEDR